jgi:hypothetical protein
MMKPENDMKELVDAIDQGYFVLVLLAGFLGACVGLAAGVVIMWTVR